MIDIHSHILFGVDDGARNIEESMEMIRVARDIGFKKIVATPHYILHSQFNSNLETNNEYLSELIQNINNENLGVDVLLGNEVFYDFEIINFLENGEVSTINNSKYLLLEITRNRVNFRNLLDYIFQLKIKGWVPILAHPERYDFVLDDPNKIIELIQRDVLIQMNLSSIQGRYGKKVKDIAKILLEHNMVHLIGSDAHKPKHYLQLAEAISQVKKLIGEEKFKEISQTNPNYIIGDQVFYPSEAKPYKKRKFPFFK